MEVEHLSWYDAYVVQTMQNWKPSYLLWKGKAPKKGGKSPKSGGKMSMGQLDKMVAGIQDIGEGDDDLSDLSDVDENELLGELQVCVCECVCCGGG